MNSQIKHQGNVTVIEGGSNVGANLFHNLKDLSIPPNGTVHFNNFEGLLKNN